MRALTAIVFLLLLAHCHQQEEASPSVLRRHTYHRAMMGTRFSITLYAEDETNAGTAAKAAFQYAADVNTACSDYDVTSELMKLNAAPHNQVTTLSPLLFDVLGRGLDIAEKTQGAYDPTLGHHSYNWRVARKRNRLPGFGKIIRAKAASGWKNLRLDPDTISVTKLVSNMRLDLGGIAKGFAADGMLKILKLHDITRASITAGGELRLGDPPPEKTGWEITVKTLAGEKILTLAQCAVSTSGDLHQSVTIDAKRYSHIVNPSTGLGLTTRVSATIIADNATLADALATAYCVNPSLHIPYVKTLVFSEKNDTPLLSEPPGNRVKP